MEYHVFTSFTRATVIYSPLICHSQDSHHAYDSDREYMQLA